MVRTRSIYAMTIHVSLVQAVASCGGFLANLRCGAVLTVNMGTKQRFSFYLVAKDRENPVLGAKNAGRWSRYAGGRLIQVTLNGRLSVHEKSVAKSRWSLKPVVV